MTNTTIRTGAALSDRMVSTLTQFGAIPTSNTISGPRRTMLALERRGFLVMSGHSTGELTADGIAIRAAYQEVKDRAAETAETAEAVETEAVEPAEAVETEAVDAYKVPCDLCGAQAGEECWAGYFRSDGMRIRRGRRVALPHRARVFASKKRPKSLPIFARVVEVWTEDR